MYNEYNMQLIHKRNGEQALKMKEGQILYLNPFSTELVPAIIEQVDIGSDYNEGITIHLVLQKDVFENFNISINFKDIKMVGGDIITFDLTKGIFSKGGRL